MRDDERRRGIPDASFDHAERYRTDEEVRQALGPAFYDSFVERVRRFADAARADAARQARAKKEGRT